MSMDAAVVGGWAGEFEALCERFAGCFRRRDLRRRGVSYIRGLLGRIHRKNAWQLAEYLGNATPHGLQRLLDRATWNVDAVRDELIHYAGEHLLAPDEGGTLIVDETGFLKKGEKSAGVQRQYSGTAGRIENCQIGVFLTLAGSGGRALIDRELYLPRPWCEDANRRDEASIPDDVTFATKPQMAMRMIERAWSARLRPRWVLADEVYGSAHKFRRFLESHGQSYVVAVTSQQRLWVDFRQQRVDAIVRQAPAEAWLRMSVGDGTKGPRLYDWTAGRFGAPSEHGLIRWLLARRSVDAPDEHAYYLCLAPADATPHDLAVAAGQRWAIECCFETAKQETGLDEYEVRSWHGWYRHITLSMLAMAFLAVVRVKANSAENAAAGGQKGAMAWCR